MRLRFHTYPLLSPLSLSLSLSFLSLSINNLCPTQKNATQEFFDTDKMAQEVLQQWGNQAFTVGQQMAFKWSDKKPLMLTVQAIECADLMAVARGQKVKKKKYREEKRSEGKKCSHQLWNFLKLCFHTPPSRPALVCNCCLRLTQGKQHGGKKQGH